MQILRKEEEMIYPADSTKQHLVLHRLSEIDQRHRHAMPVLFFYRDAPQSCAAGLKLALSKMLVVFYPLAGRLEERGADERGGRVDVRCLGQGVPFCEAWTDSTLDHAFPPPIQPHTDFSAVLLTHHVHLPLCIQVTHFGCGGICLCVTCSHALGDALSIIHFMQGWVETTIGKQSLSLYPCFNELPLEVTHAPNAPLEPTLMHFEQKKNISKPIVGRDSIITSARCFHFTPTFIESLKTTNNYANKKYTSFECICAYLWKNVMLARDLSPLETTCLNFPVDGRKRFNPPLPQEYFGNTVFLARAITLGKNLVEKPLLYVADLVKEASMGITDQYMREHLHMLGKEVAPFNTSPNNPTTLLISSWKEFPFYKFDFGWGNPSCFMPPAPLNSSNRIVLLPTSLGKDYIDVVVCLDIKSLEKLQSLIYQEPTTHAS